MLTHTNVLQAIGISPLFCNLRKFDCKSFIQCIAVVFFLASISFSSHAQDIDYERLTNQEKADLARYLGWVWGDGRPGFDGTGILYHGKNPNYKALVTRLANIKIDGIKNPFGFPESGDRKHSHVWSYWVNSLPGGNPGDPEILRRAIKHPNFLAGIIEGEGQIFHSDPDQDYYLADQSYAPSHPDKFYDVANFGPERMIQLFSLLEETYGFSNPAMSIGRTKYQHDTQRCVVLEKIREKYQQVKEQNERGNLQAPFIVKIYIKPPDFDEIRRYGFFKKGDLKYRTPAPDNFLSVINNSLSDLNTEMVGTTNFFDNDGADGTRLQHESGYYLNSNLNMVWGDTDEALNWKFIDLNNGFYRIESQDSAIANKWLQGLNNQALKMVDERRTGHFTQWEKIPVWNTDNTYYLKNRFHDTYLRVNSFNSNVKHSATRNTAQWTLENGTTACTQ